MTFDKKRLVLAREAKTKQKNKSYFLIFEAAAGNGFLFFDEIIQISRSLQDRGQSLHKRVSSENNCRHLVYADQTFVFSPDKKSRSKLLKLFDWLFLPALLFTL